eukprot:m.719346 g.719346  ORF g.719346 m.719346 type:complete len:359 (+) comp22999_c1_seq15:986-2062(+)
MLYGLNRHVGVAVGRLRQKYASRSTALSMSTVFPRKVSFPVCLSSVATLPAPSSVGVAPAVVPFPVPVLLKCTDRGSSASSVVDQMSCFRARSRIVSMSANSTAASARLRPLPASVALICCVSGAPSMRVGPATLPSSSRRWASSSSSFRRRSSSRSDATVANDSVCSADPSPATSAPSGRVGDVAASIALAESAEVPGASCVSSHDCKSGACGASSEIADAPKTERVLLSDSCDNTRLRRLRRYTTPCALPPAPTHAHTPKAVTVVCLCASSVGAATDGGVASANLHRAVCNAECIPTNHHHRYSTRHSKHATGHISPDVSAASQTPSPPAGVPRGEHPRTVCAPKPPGLQHQRLFW